MMRRRWFLFLKCGSGKQKKSLLSCPLYRKLGRNFMAFVRTQVALCWLPEGCSSLLFLRRALITSSTYSTTLLHNS